MDPDIELQIRVDVLGLENLRRLGSVVNGLKRNLDAVSESANEQRSRWDTLRERLEHIEEKYDAVFRAGFRLQNLGADLNRIGKEMISWLDAAVDAWGEFEFILAKVSASSGIVTRQAPMYEKLKDAVMDTAVSLRFLPLDEVTQAFYHWSTTTGQNIETMEDLRTAQEGVAAAVKTAIITQTDYESAIKGAYSIVKQYGLELSDIPEIMAELHLVTIRTSLEFGDLINTFKFLGPIASQLGMSFGEAARTVGMLGDLGIRGTMAGRGLAMMLTKLVRPTYDNVNAFEELMKRTLGVDDAWDQLMFPNGEFIGFENLVTLLAKSTADLTQQERMNYITRIASTQNAARVILPLINAQIDAFKEGSDIFNDPKYSVEGAMQRWREQWELVSTTWMGTVEHLKRGADVVRALIGEQVANVLTPFVNKLAEGVDGLRKWLDEHPQVVQFAASLLAAAGAAVVLAGAFFAVIGTLLVFGAGVGLAIETLMNVAVTMFATRAELKALEDGVVSVGKLFGPVFGRILSIVTQWGSLIGFVVAIVVSDFGGIRSAVEDLVSLFAEMGPFIGRVVQQAGRTIETFSTGIGIAFGIASAIVRAFVEAIRTVLSWLQPVEDDTYEVADATDFFAQAIGTLIGAFLGLKVALSVIGALKAAWIAWKAVTAFVAARVVAAHAAMAGAAVIHAAAENLAFGAAMRKNIGQFIAAMLKMSVLGVVLNGLSIAVTLFRGALTFLALHPVMAAIIIIITGITLVVMALGGAFKWVGEVVNNFAMDFGDMGDALHQLAEDTGESYQSVKDAVQDAMSEHNMSFEEAVAHTRELHEEQQTLVQGQARAQAALKGTTEDMAGLGDQTQLTVEDLEAMGVEVDPAMAEFLASVEGGVAGAVGALEEGGPAMGEATEEMMRPTISEIREARRQMVIEAWKTPSEIAEAILAGKEDIETVATTIKEILTGSIKDSVAISQNTAALLNPGIAKALKGNSKEAKAAMLNDVVEPLLDSINTLQPGAFDAGAKISPELKKAIEQNGSLAITALRDLVGDADATLEELAKWARENGLDGIASLIEGMISKRTATINAAKNIAKAARDELKFDASSGGRSSAQTFVNGLVLGLGTYWHNVRTQLNLLKADTFGNSLPRKGPFSAAELRAGATSVGEYYLTTLAQSMSGGLAGLNGELLPGLDNRDLTVSTDSRKELVVKVDVTSSDGTVSDSNAATIGEAIHKGLMLDRLEHIAAVE